LRITRETGGTVVTTTKRIHEYSSNVVYFV
jgi:hypothetical protein